MWEDHPQACLRQGSRTASHTTAASPHPYTHCLSLEQLPQPITTLNQSAKTTESRRGYSPWEEPYWLAFGLPWVSRHQRLNGHGSTLREKDDTDSVKGLVLTAWDLTLSRRKRTPVFLTAYTLWNRANYLLSVLPFINGCQRLCLISLTLNKHVDTNSTTIYPASAVINF